MKLLAIMALLPIAIGPLPVEERSLTISLCLGGEITIPFDDENDDHEGPCHQQGCHAGTCREQSRTGKRTN